MQARRLLVAALALGSLFGGRAAIAQPSATQVLFEEVPLPAATAFRPTSTVDLTRFVGGNWLIFADFADTTAAKLAVIEFHIELITEGTHPHAFAYDTDNSNDRRDGFLVTAMDSTQLVTSSGGASTYVTPTGGMGSYPHKISSMRYFSDDKSAAPQSRLSVPGGSSSTSRGWVVPIADAFGNAQWYQGRVKLIAINRSPSQSPVALLTVLARGQRAF